MSGEEAAAVMEVEIGKKGFNVHYHHSCDGCNASPIIGKRFKSTDAANFDLCSTCFEKYDGDELFAETLLDRDSNNTDYVLKIKTSDGPEASQIRRINVADLWEDAELSYAKLIAVASKFASNEDVDMSKVRATYVDGDGDKITISSNSELMSSFRQSLKPTRKPFRITVLFPTDNGVKAPPAVAAGKHPRRIIRIEKQIAKKSGELEALKVKAKLASARPPVARGGQKQCGWMDSQKFDSSFFIHARHTCDGCSKTPIIGARYRATHIPDFDLCSSCFDKYEGEKGDFKKEALECDRNMQKWWLKKHLSNSRMCEIHVSPACEGYSKPGNKTEAEGQNPVESVIDILKTLSPAVAESLKEVKVHVSPPCEGFSKKAKSEEQASEECTASKPDSEEETNDVKPKSGSDDSKDDSFFSEADGNSIAEVIGKTLDVCVQAMEDVMLDDAVQKSSKDAAAAAAAVSADAFSVASSIAAELMSASAPPQFDANSNDNEDKGLKTEESSNGEDDWSVVTDENAGGETKQKDEVVKDEESDKSITSVEPISAVVLAKWDLELRQLHELGFLDDRVNTNALEHLEASHLGCGSDEAVTVNAAVEHILKN